MARAPGGQKQGMAAWTRAGSAGAAGGPLLLAGVVAGGGPWGSAYLLLAAAAGGALAAAALAAPSRPPVRFDREATAGADSAGVGDGDGDGGRRTSVREALNGLRQRDVARWAVLLEISDLLPDGLTGYIAIYLVDVAGASPAEAALGVAVRLGAGPAGDAPFVVISQRVSGPAPPRGSAI